MSRPNTFTPEFRDAYLRAIRDGNFRNNAARIAGRHPKTVERWITLGRSEDGPEEYREWLAEVEQAEAEAIGKSVKQIRDAGHEDWKAAKAYLVAKCPEDWGDKARRSAKQAIEEILRVVEAELGTKTAQRIMARLAEASSEQASESAQSDAGNRTVHH